MLVNVVHEQVEIASDMKLVPCLSAPRNGKEGTNICGFEIIGSQEQWTPQRIIIPSKGICLLLSTGNSARVMKGECSSRGDGTEMMAAIDQTKPYAEFIIADIARDGAWLTIRETETLSLVAWK